MMMSCLWRMPYLNFEMLVHDSQGEASFRENRQTRTEVIIIIIGFSRLHLKCNVTQRNHAIKLPHRDMMNNYE